MSRPFKRFVLPYEPEYTAHRTDSRVARAGQVHRSVRRSVAGPPLVPHDAGNEPAPDGPFPGNSIRAVELSPGERFPPRR
jgi:hypothetical protein